MCSEAYPVKCINLDFCTAGVASALGVFHNEQDEETRKY
jgi:hypothetical protein